MTQSGNFKFHTPIFRVNNRQENIDFYQNTLGFKLLTEENTKPRLFSKGKKGMLLKQSHLRMVLF